MKRIITTLLAITLMFSCSGIIQAEEHQHDWSSWDYYKSDNANHYAQRYCIDCGKAETKAEAHALLPNPSQYSYGDENTCYAEYRCKICREYSKTATTHKWNEQISNWKFFTNEKHQRSVYKQCTQCGSTSWNLETENHNLGFHGTTFEGKPAVYYGCDICNYHYGNKVSYKTYKGNITLSKNQYFVSKLPLLYTDKIKSIKVTSGKKNVKVKKKSNTSIKVTGKKKGKAKIKVTSNAGITCIITVKVKKR